MASQEERDRIMAEYMASVQNDNDDEDEGEFEPTANDDDDDDDDSSVDEDDGTGVVLTGTLIKKEDRLVYSGTWRAATDQGGDYKFKLKSKPQKMPLHWDASSPTISDPSKTQPPRMRTMVFDGFFVTMEGVKMKERDVNITFTVQAKGNDTIATKNYKNDDDENDVDDDFDENEHDEEPTKKPAAKSDDVDGKMPSKPAAAEADSHSKMPSQKSAKDDDGKMASKPSTTSQDLSNGDATGTSDSMVCGVFGRGINDYGNFEFEGIWDTNLKNLLVCRKRYVQSGGAAAAAKGPDSSDEDEADDAVDFEELIALHQDAGLPVEELRKRYRGDGSSSGRNDSKRQRVEDIDEEEFDGF